MSACNRHAVDYSGVGEREAVDMRVYGMALHAREVYLVC